MKRSVLPIRESTYEEIARVAYYFYEERGRKHGHDVEDWLRAEAHVCTDEEHVSKWSERLINESAKPRTLGTATN